MKHIGRAMRVIWDRSTSLLYWLKEELPAPYAPIQDPIPDGKYINPACSCEIPYRSINRVDVEACNELRFM